MGADVVEAVNAGEAWRRLAKASVCASGALAIIIANIRVQVKLGRICWT
jgi:hypothetical protein